MFINLRLEFTEGPHKGEELPLMCLGEGNLVYRLDEVAEVSGVKVVGVDVAGGNLSESAQARVSALLAEE